LATPACTSGTINAATASDPGPGGLAGDVTQASDTGLGDPGGVGDPNPTIITPNPDLAALGDNTALDLGSYGCRDRVSEEALHCELITDYSRLNYDPYQHRVLLFGGGHAATGRTDVDVLNLETLAWSSLYPSMTCDEVAANNIDPRGFHVATGHPAARHTYDQSVIVELGGVGRLLLMSTEGFAGYCHQYNAPMNGIPSLSLAAGNITWAYGAEFAAPWSYADAAEFDPVSGMVIMIGSTINAGEGGMWIFNPETSAVVTFVDSVGYFGLSANLVYYPPNGNMYLFAAGQNDVREVVLDRSDWSRTTSTLLTVTGDVPASPTGFAYDSQNQVIGGGINNNRFYTFDPIARAWQSELMVVASNGATPGVVLFHVLDYDVLDNVYIFIADGSDGRRTWAYRYRR